MQIFYDLQDLRYLDWSRIRHSSGTAGSLLKAQEKVDGKNIYYKLSQFDSGRGKFGFESVNEIIVDRLLDAMGINHLQYQLVHGLISIEDKEYETYVCRSSDYKKPGEKKSSLEAYYQTYAKPGESVLDFCIGMGWADYIYEMLVVDYLILNRDRHGANIEVLKSTDGTVRLAPIFDNGLSLLYDCKNPRALTKQNLLEDKKVMDFIGSGYTFENLILIPKDKLIKLPSNRKRILNDLFEGIADSIYPKDYQEKTIEMISERWKLYEVFRNKK
ncbi:MAG: hypothetical protein K5769_07135 [Pseudobutyrivibrio sp.]|nr:hypothetical protein [Pseudobutyrivibrio sp.]